MRAKQHIPAAIDLAIEKIENLIRLATDRGTTEQERRSAAVAACDMIRKHDLRISVAPAVKKKPSTTNGWHVNWQKDFGAKAPASCCGICFFCKKPYAPYDEIRPTFFGHIHEKCLKSWTGRESER